MADSRTVKKLRSAFIDKIVLRAATDARFRKQLADNPEAAIAAAGLKGHLAKLEKALGRAEPARCGPVTCGYRSCGKNQVTCIRTCQVTEKAIELLP